MPGYIPIGRATRHHNTGIIREGKPARENVLKEKEFACLLPAPSF
jgi:hypothetical protein